ncbi:glycoside hydrolase family 2 protein [Undibacterium curvum]|uniref:glycoside hydrolase family 2 protein n=1 Tax=Undibacterium curvum TaxID=2762294 RepID=UPI003D0BD24D
MNGHYTSASAAPSLQALQAAWQMAIVHAGRYALASEAEQEFLNGYPVQLPCTVISALAQAGEFQFQDLQLDDKDVWFRCQLDFPPEAQFLHFDGLATHTEIFWNDRLLQRTDNMFLRYTLNLQELEVHGQGTLAIRCCALNAELAKKRPRPRWKTRLVEQQQLRWLRTSLLGRMPGWSPPVPPVGPYRDIWIEYAAPVRLSEVQLQTRLSAQDGVVSFSATCVSEEPLLQASLHVGSYTQQLDLNQTSDCGTAIQGELLFPSPQLWWPHTHGRPQLYTACLALTTAHGQSLIALGELGFRHIHVDTRDSNFSLHVNDVPVFCRGACWTPADLLSLNASEEKQRQMLTLARDAGMNMLRVVGTMVYENAHFYRLCDELGILVWQDFMFANMDYPVADLAFGLQVCQEAKSFLSRTQTSACLAVLCGNSEIEQQAAMLGQPRENWSNPFFSESLPQICQELRPDCIYWPSSPSGGVMPFQVDSGVAHYFGVGAYLRPLDDARRSGVRFTSECLGFSNMPEDSLLDSMSGQGDFPGLHPSWKKAVPRDHGTGWDFEDVRDHYLQQLYGLDPARLRYAERERYIALSRLTSGEVMAQALHEWRRHGSACHGALIWFWRDLWAGAGWGLVDASGQPKAAYYFVKRAMAAQLVFFTDEGLNGLAIHVRNDAASSLHGSLHLRLTRHADTNIADISVPVQVAPHSSIMLRADALLPHFMDTSYAYRFGPPGHHLASVHLTRNGESTACSHDHHFPAARLAGMESDAGLDASWQPEGNGMLRLHLSCRRFLHGVQLQVSGAEALDNYFHLSPGLVYTVRLRLLGAVEQVKVQVNAINLLSAVRLRPPAEALNSSHHSYPGDQV